MVLLHCLQPDFKYLLLVWLKNNAIRWQAILHRFSLWQYFKHGGKHTMAGWHITPHTALWGQILLGYCVPPCLGRRTQAWEAQCFTSHRKDPQDPRPKQWERKEQHSSNFNFWILSMSPREDYVGWVFDCGVCSSQSASLGPGLPPPLVSTKETSWPTMKTEAERIGIIQLVWLIPQLDKYFSVQELPSVLLK